MRIPQVNTLYEALNRFSLINHVLDFFNLFHITASCPTSGSVLAEIVLDIYVILSIRNIDKFFSRITSTRITSSLLWLHLFKYHKTKLLFPLLHVLIIQFSIQFLAIKPPVCPTCTQAEFEIPNYLIPQAETTYECYSFVMPNDTDRRNFVKSANLLDIIRIEPIINNSLILHHIVVFSSDTYYPGFLFIPVHP